MFPFVQSNYSDGPYLASTFGYMGMNGKAQPASLCKFFCTPDRIRRLRTFRDLVQGRYYTEQSAPFALQQGMIVPLMFAGRHVAILLLVELERGGGGGVILKVLLNCPVYDYCTCRAVPMRSSAV